jgi:hypothetical protein
MRLQLQLRRKGRPRLEVHHGDDLVEEHARQAWGAGSAVERGAVRQ